MIDSYEIVLYSFLNGISSIKKPAYKLKDVINECNKLLNDYINQDNERLKLSVRDRVRETVIFTADIDNLNALKSSNDFIDLKRGIESILTNYEFTKNKEFYPVRIEGY